MDLAPHLWKRPPRESGHSAEPVSLSVVPQNQFFLDRERKRNACIHSHILFEFQIRQKTLVRLPPVVIINNNNNWCMLFVKVHKLCNDTIRQTQTTPSIYIHTFTRDFSRQKTNRKHFFFLSFIFSFCADVGSGNEVTSLLN